MHIQLAAGSFRSIRASGRRGRDHGLLSANTGLRPTQSDGQLAAIRRVLIHQRVRVLRTSYFVIALPAAIIARICSLTASAIKILR